MKDPKHKGNEFTNISEVWEQNERNDAPEDATSNRETLGDENLEQVIEEEQRITTAGKTRPCCKKGLPLIVLVRTL
jgi:hypothetical protein